MVPKTCANFLRLIMKKRNGLKGSKIHRICKPSWIQGGGCSNIQHKRSQFSENYIIPHDRRGVLSMCHNGTDRDNAIQFNITLNPAEWMDNKYVAFGQLVIGDDVLSKIEDVETYYEYPLKTICIADAGLYTFDHIIPKKEQLYLECFLNRGIIADSDRNNKSIQKYVVPKDLIDKRDLTSEFQIKNYVAGLYSFYQDRGSMNWPYSTSFSAEKSQELQSFLKNKKSAQHYPPDELDSRDVPSQLSISQFQAGYYYFPLDEECGKNEDDVEVSMPKTHLGLFV